MFGHILSYLWQMFLIVADKIKEWLGECKNRPEKPQSVEIKVKDPQAMDMKVKNPECVEMRIKNNM